MVEDMTDHWRTPDRDRGILTKSDRKYLLGEKVLEGQDERNARFRIRSRLIQSLLDMALLNEELDTRDMEQVVTDERLSNDWIPIMLISQANAFLYYDDDTLNSSQKLENWVEQSITARPPRRGPVRDDGKVGLVDITASVSIEFDEDPIDVRGMLPDEITEGMSQKELEEYVEEIIRRDIEEDSS